MSVLDHHLGTLAVVRWAQALVLGTGLLLLGDLIARLGFLLRALGRGQGLDVLQHYAVRTPEMLALWLPVAPLVAGMLTAAPMRRDGTLVALCAAGLAPARIYRGLLMVGVASGIVAWALADRLLPALAPRAEAVEARLDGDLSGGAARARAAGWRTAQGQWSAAAAYPGQGRYAGIAVRTVRPERLVVAERMEWSAAGWTLHGVLVIQDQRTRTMAWAAPAALGLEPPPPRDDLATGLRPVRDIPGHELRLDRRQGQAEAVSRLLRGLLPAAVLAWGLATFLSAYGRRHPGMAVAMALAAAAGPVVLVLVTDRLLLASRTPVAVLGLTAAALLILPTWWRWRSMRL
jgi:lipopolysaccharide export LptBFGC system permease protein LptF